MSSPGGYLNSPLYRQMTAQSQQAPQQQSGGGMEDMAVKVMRAYMMKNSIADQNLNPVTVTPQVSAPNLPDIPGATPINDPARLAAYNAPMESPTTEKQRLQMASLLMGIGR